MRPTALTAPLGLAALLVLPAPAAAGGGGPWKDGELVVRSQIGFTQTQVIYRVEPETGHGEELLSGFFWGGWAGSLVFDPHRDGLLGSFGMPPAIFQEELWLIDSNGDLELIPGFHDVPLRALAPTGDGRVYFQRHAGDPTYPILYLDENDALHTLMDASGTAPFEFSVEHLLWHPETNSLLATNSGWWSPNDCVEGDSSVFRIPLSADGSRVDGPVACASVAGVDDNIMGMDYLPGGDVLLQMSGSQFFHETMRRLDPLTLQTTVFATPSQEDIDGAVWSARIGKAVLLDDTANQLRLFSPGQSGSGTLLPSDVDVSPPTTGFSPMETLIELDLLGPACAGTAHPFGDGLAGAGGFVPALAATSCPDLGLPFSIEIEHVVGGGLGGLAVGFTETALPLFGGTFHVLPVLTVPIAADGAPGAPGAGGLSIPTVFQSPSLVGTSVLLQAGFLDPAAVENVSLTNALRLSVG